MPTQDTWSAVAGVNSSGTAGRNRSWERTPNFKTLPRDSLPVNLYTDLNRRTSQSTYYAIQTPPGGSPVYVVPPGYPYTHGNIYSFFQGRANGTEAAVLDLDARNTALVRSLGKIADTKTNISVTLAEASKTSDLILNTANRIDRAYRAFRKGRFTEVAKILNITPGRVHKNWLEYKYGWMPLLLDVKNSAEFLAQQSLTRKPRFTVSSKVKWETAMPLSTPYAPWGDPNPTAVVKEEISCEGEVKVKIWCEIDNPTLSELQQLGVTNPALVAWELVPYSFVFDWFLQVGNFLEATTALNGIVCRRAMMSSKKKWKWLKEYPHTVRVNNGTTFDSSEHLMSIKVDDFGRWPISPASESIWPVTGKGVNNFPKLLTSLALLKAGHRGTGTRI